MAIADRLAVMSAGAHRADRPRRGSLYRVAAASLRGRIPRPREPPANASPRRSRKACCDIGGASFACPPRVAGPRHAAGAPRGHARSARRRPAGPRPRSSSAPSSATACSCACAPTDSRRWSPTCGRDSAFRAGDSVGIRIEPAPPHGLAGDPRMTTFLVQLQRPPHPRAGPPRLRPARHRTLLCSAPVQSVLQLQQRPDAVVITGDLSDFGRAAEYSHLAQLLAPLRDAGLPDARQPRRSRPAAAQLPGPRLPGQRGLRPVRGTRSVRCACSRSTPACPATAHGTLVRRSGSAWLEDAARSPAAASRW